MSGCSDFLEVTKYGASTTWETKDDVDRAVAALWSNVSNDSEGVTGRGIMWFECCSDNITVGRPQGEANQIRDFKMSPSNGRDVKDTWGAMYQINAKANNIRPTDFPYDQVVRIYSEVVSKEYPEGNKNCPMSEELFRRTLDPVAIVRNRRTSGGPQPEEMKKALSGMEKTIADQTAWTKGKRDQIDTALNRLDADFRKLLQD